MREAQVLMDLAHVADVRHDRQAVAMRQIGHLPEFRDARQPHDIGLHIMHRARLDEIAELRRHVKLFAQGDGGGDGLGESAMPCHVVEENGLLDPGHVEIDEPTGGLDRLRQASSGRWHRS